MTDQFTEQQLFQMAKSRGVDPGFAPKAERKTRKNDESISQRAVIKWWDMAHQMWKLPVGVLFSIPNGGGRSGPRLGAILKAEGLRRGAPDLFLAVAHGGKHGLFIEMKVTGGVVKAEQKQFAEILEAQGYTCKTCWSTADALATITSYLWGIVP